MFFLQLLGQYNFIYYNQQVEFVGGWAVWFCVNNIDTVNDAVNKGTIVSRGVSLPSKRFIYLAFFGLILYDHWS